jgi:hypothetical protein
MPSIKFYNADNQEIAAFELSIKENGFISLPAEIDSIIPVYGVTVSEILEYGINDGIGVDTDYAENFYIGYDEEVEEVIFSWDGDFMENAEIYRFEYKA